MNIPTITPTQLHQAAQRGQSFRLIDVRTPAEFAEAHVGLADNLPLHRLDPTKLAADAQAARTPVYVICRSGSRGRQACQRLLAAGLHNVANVEGGTQAWEQAGLPLVRGRKAISLERQVRIAAGGLVVLGAVLALLVHPYWIALAALIGAGLVFAGITDTCGMAILLAKMPWNQVKPTAGAANQSNATCCSP
jgi:rhodanese-related sulfurtransferase